CGLMYTWSIALLAAPSANRALPVRLYALLLWCVSLGVTFTAMCFPEPWVPSAGLLATWLVGMTGFACLNLAISIGERRHFSHRLTRTIPHAPVLRRLAFL